MEYIKLLDEEARNIHKVISSGKEILELKYDTNVKLSENKEEIEYNYMNALKENLSKDIDYRTTQIGPHRDDMIININDNSARVFGSQGQQRSTVLSLKLAEVEIIKKQRGSYPVLLLDDVYSELDMDRRKYLTELFNNMQTFITVSNSESLDSIKYANKTIYNIEDGKIINRR